MGPGDYDLIKEYEEKLDADVQALVKKAKELNIPMMVIAEIYEKDTGDGVRANTRSATTFPIQFPQMAVRSPMIAGVAHILAKDFYNAEVDILNMMISTGWLSKEKSDIIMEIMEEAQEANHTPENNLNRLREILGSMGITLPKDIEEMAIGSMSQEEPEEHKDKPEEDTDIPDNIKNDIRKLFGQVGE